jgi:hypothetical protein
MEEAGKDPGFLSMYISRLQYTGTYLGGFDRVEPPVHFYVMLAHETGLPRRVDESGAQLASPSEIG